MTIRDHNLMPGLQFPTQAHPELDNAQSDLVPVTMASHTTHDSVANRKTISFDRRSVARKRSGLKKLVFVRDVLINCRADASCGPVIRHGSSMESDTLHRPSRNLLIC